MIDRISYTLIFRSVMIVAAAITSDALAERSETPRTTPVFSLYTSFARARGSLSSAR